MTVKDARALLAREKLEFGNTLQMLAADTIEAFELAKELNVAADPDNCPECKGEKSRECEKCDGSGSCIECGATCGKCDGDGEIACENCKSGKMKPVELEGLTKEELKALIKKANTHA